LLADCLDRQTVFTREHAIMMGTNTVAEFLRPGPDREIRLRIYDAVVEQARIEPPRGDTESLISGILWHLRHGSSEAEAVASLAQK